MAARTSRGAHSRVNSQSLSAQAGATSQPACQRTGRPCAECASSGTQLRWPASRQAADVRAGAQLIDQPIAHAEQECDDQRGGEVLSHAPALRLVFDVAQRVADPRRHCPADRAFALERNDLGAAGRPGAICHSSAICTHDNNPSRAPAGRLLRGSRTLRGLHFRNLARGECSQIGRQPVEIDVDDRRREQRERLADAAARPRSRSRAAGGSRRRCPRPA